MTRTPLSRSKGHRSRSQGRGHIVALIIIIIIITDVVRSQG